MSPARSPPSTPPPSTHCSPPHQEAWARRIRAPTSNAAPTFRRPAPRPHHLRRPTRGRGGGRRWEGRGRERKEGKKKEGEEGDDQDLAEERGASAEEADDHETVAPSTAERSREAGSERADWLEVEDIDPDTGEFLGTHLQRLDADGETDRGTHQPDHPIDPTMGRVLGRGGRHG